MLSFFGSNYYVTGYFSGTATFSGQTRTSSGGRDIFIAIYSNSLSNTLQSLKTGGGPSDDQGEKLIINENRTDFYVSGKMSRSFSFENINKFSNSENNIFMAQFHIEGAINWMKTANDNLGIEVHDLALDDAENLMVAGHFSGSARFGNFRKTAVGNRDIFLLKLQ